MALTITALERRSEPAVASLVFTRTHPARSGWYAEVEKDGRTLYLSVLDDETHWVIDGLVPAGTAMPAFMHGWGSRVTRLYLAPADVQALLDGALAEQEAEWEARTERTNR